MTEPKLPTLEPRQFSAEQIDLIKRTICKDASDDELSLFVSTAKRLGLDPFARQIFAVRRWDRTIGERGGFAMAIQVSIDGFRLIADRTDCYVPGRKTEIEYSEEALTSGGKLLVSATAFVQKFVRGSWHEVGETAHFDESIQRNKNGDPNAMWARMPRVMLSKCAEARALRRAFPAEFGNVYTPEELPGEGPPPSIEYTPGTSDQQPAELPTKADPALPNAGGAAEMRLALESHDYSTGDIDPKLAANLNALPPGPVRSELSAIYAKMIKDADRG